MTDKNDFRNKFLASNKAGIDESESWEYLVVKEVTKPAPQVRRLIYQASRTMFDRDTLCLAAFYDVLPSFPIYLSPCAESKKVRGLTIRKLFNNFGGQFLLDEYAHICDIAATTGYAKTPVGVVVKWPNIEGGMLLHDYSYDFVSPGVRMFNTLEGKLVTLEPFAQFVAALPSTAYEP